MEDELHTGNFSETYSTDDSSEDSSEDGSEAGSISNSDNQSSDHSEHNSSSDEEEYEYEWREFSQFTQSFQSAPKDPVILCDNLNAESKCLDFFELFFTNQIMSTISRETNKYAEGNENFEPITPPELWSFFSLVILSGLVKKPAWKDFWTTNEMTETPFFLKVFSRNRFMQILRYLHFDSNSNSNTTDRLCKFGTILNSLLENFAKWVRPGTNLCIDESLVKFKGRLAFKMFIPSKRSRLGIKVT
jgi:Transposase IS4